jgi:dynein heavy chain, axonemal
VEALEVRTNEQFELKEVLGDNLEIADWINHGLPKDDLSISNGILVSKTLQHPMMIDPQLQASRWIKNSQKKNEMVQLKVGTDNLLKRLETVLRLKNPILL